MRRVLSLPPSYLANALTAPRGDCPSSSFDHSAGVWEGEVLAVGSRQVANVVIGQRR
jgi:hypothetical protein